MGWLGEKALFGIARGAWLLVAFGALVALIAWINASEKSDDAANQAIGRAEAINEGQKTTLQQVGAANEAGNEVRTGAGNARYDECMRSAAEGYAGYCERYRVDQPLPGGPGPSASPGAGA